MTLLHLITRLSLGGSARNTLDSAAAAVRAGYRTLLATGPSGAEYDMTNAVKRSGAELLLLPALKRSVSPLHDTRALFQTLELIRRERVDIIHTHTSKAGFIGRVAAFIARVPVVVHTPHGHILHSYYGSTVTHGFVLLERFAAKLSDRIIVLTERGAEEHLARGIGRPEQYVTIPSGVDVEALRSIAPPRHEARSRLGWPEQCWILLGVGRLVPVKGFDIAVQAMKEILKVSPDSQLLLVGDGPERARLENLARQLEIGDKLIFAGVSEEVALYLAAADVLVVPSRNEGMGRVIVEAMALELPVVATRVGGIPLVVRQGECGLLVPSNDPGALAGAVLRLLQSPDLRAQLGERGVEQAKHFSLNEMETRLLHLYRSLATEKGLPVPLWKARDLHHYSRPNNS